ncbi:hypothetical protein P12x_005322 [Tundrisphaera lichenicola]|uniref:hypothetical protein n=1 Tax=Tundrisphaera lichenicola TaxID=2029860 RepID=UPI003EBCD155
MYWKLSYRADNAALPLANRHYSRQKPDTSQFVAPGRCVVLTGLNADALWVSLWQRPEFVDHAWKDAWVCSLFRNESAGLSSELVRQAVAATRFDWPRVPSQGMVTFVDPNRVRRKRDPGRCFVRAGFQPCGVTKGGLLVFKLPPDAMPEAETPIGGQFALL